jgi:hypothetical protein
LARRERKKPLRGKRDIFLPLRLCAKQIRPTFAASSRASAISARNFWESGIRPITTAPISCFAIPAKAVTQRVAVATWFPLSRE